MYDLAVFFALLGSAHVKALLKMLVKLTPVISRPLLYAVCIFSTFKDLSKLVLTAFRWFRGKFRCTIVTNIKFLFFYIYQPTKQSLIFVQTKTLFVTITKSVITIIRTREF